MVSKQGCPKPIDSWLLPYWCKPLWHILFLSTPAASRRRAQDIRAVYVEASRNYRPDCRHVEARAFGSAKIRGKIRSARPGTSVLTLGSPGSTVYAKAIRRCNEWLWYS
jgi:hypothetical protein